MNEPLHRFTWTSKNEGPCDSHGCTGHVTYTVVCRCGWTMTYPTQYSSQREVEIMLYHRLDYLEKVVRQLEAKHL